MSSTNSNVSGVTQPVGTRGPAPPLPEKPPSVAERTRLLRSSFRKDEVEKPRMDINRSSPLSELTRSAGSSVSSLNSHTNGDREESPPSIINGVSSNNVLPKPTVQPTFVPPPAPAQTTVPVMDNKEAEKQAAAVSCGVNSSLFHSLNFLNG